MEVCAAHYVVGWRTNVEIRPHNNSTPGDIFSSLNVITGCAVVRVIRHRIASFSCVYIPGTFFVFLGFVVPAVDAICEVTWVETQSIPWQVCLFSKSLVLLTSATLRNWRESALLFSRVVMTSDKEGLSPAIF